MSHGSERERSLHNGGQVRHVAVVLWAERVLPRGVELVDFGLQPFVHIRVRQQAVGDTGERDRGGVRPCDDCEDPIVDEVLHGGRRLVWEVFVVLWSAR